MSQKIDIALQVRMEKTVLLYNENRQGLLMSLMVATMVCSALITQVDLVKCLVWWTVLASVLLLRMLLFVKFQTTCKQLTEENLAYWHRLFIAGALLYGLSWGLGAPYFASEVDFEFMLLIVVVMISLCVGAVPYLFYSMIAVEGYLITIVGPMTLWLYLQPDLIYAMTGIVCTVFVLSTYLTARKLNALMTNAMRLQLENAELSNDLIKANYELKTLSSTDPLSGIANRRAFEKNFEQTLLQCQRDQSDISLIMFDIDHFKQFNDTYGHLAGDRIIHLVAQISSDTLKRPLDMVARYGGEEYIIMLPNTDVDGALQVAEAIRIGVEQADISEHTEAGKNITISGGVTTINARNAKQLQEYVRLADEGLYHAKEQGRNCVKVVLPE